MVTARCMKCKAQKEVKDPRQITMKNGRPAIKGTCPDCGTTMFKIGRLEQSSKNETDKPDDGQMLAGIGEK